MEAKTYSRKPFFVQAVRVTKENFDEVRFWCAGEEKSKDTDHWIEIRVSNARTPQQAQARVGDWVLKGEKGTFKVFTNKAFEACFDRVQTASEEALLNLKNKLSPNRV